MFGASSVIGPLLGAWITDSISWHWVFYVNIPIGAISLFLIIRFYKETAQPIKQTIDWLGAITLVTAVVSLMFGLELGGKQFAWLSWQSISLFSIFIVFFIIFIWAETKAKEPIISFWMFKNDFLLHPKRWLSYMAPHLLGLRFSFLFLCRPYTVVLLQMQESFSCQCFLARSLGVQSEEYCRRKHRTVTLW